MSVPLPRSVPTGTDHYYKARLADFAARCPETAPPSYYADYGDKCLHQFRRTEPELTLRGQRWLQDTLVDLQERLEHRRAADPAAFGRLERDSAAFKKMAFQMHSDAYLESGIAELPVGDLWKIAKTPDVSDLVTPNGLKEIVRVCGGLGTDERQSMPRRVLQTVRQGLRRLRARYRARYSGNPSRSGSRSVLTPGGVRRQGASRQWRLRSVGGACRRGFR